MRFYTVKDFVRWNEGQQCSASGCTRMRHRKSKWCAHHADKMAYAGCLEAQTTLFKPQYMSEVKQVRKVLERNIADHEGLNMVIRYVNSRMQAAAAGQDIKNARCWRGLSLYEASPIDIIARAGAIFTIWASRSPLIKSEAHLLYNAGRCIMGLTKQAKLGINGYRYLFKNLGKELDDEFRLFFISLAKATLDMVEREHQRKEVLSQGFK